MAAALGWEPEPMFGDALAGSAGMSDPVQPSLFSSSAAADTFPDALSGVLVAGDSYVRPALTQQSAAATPGPAVAAPPPPRRAPQRPWSNAAPPRLPPQQGVLPPQQGVQWSRTAPRNPAGGPPPQYLPAQYPPTQYGPATVTPLSRNQVVGVSALGPAPRPGPGQPLVRPPAYLPQGAGLAQLRAALQQAGQSTANRSRATAAATGRKGAGLWGVLFALLIVLVVTGVAEKVISWISHLLQGM